MEANSAYGNVELATDETAINSSYSLEQNSLSSIENYLLEFFPNTQV